MVYIGFFQEEDDTWKNMYKQLKDAEIKCVVMALGENCFFFEEDLKDEEEALEDFPTPEILERNLIERGLILDTDYTNRCGNCHEYLNPKDKYCKKCGTKRGKGKFKPFENTVYCVYGPCIKKKYKCTACGHVWITENIGGFENSRYCSKCGKRCVKKQFEKTIDLGTYFMELEAYHDEDEME